MCHGTISKLSWLSVWLTWRGWDSVCLFHDRTNANRELTFFASILHNSIGETFILHKRIGSVLFTLVLVFIFDYEFFKMSGHPNEPLSWTYVYMNFLTENRVSQVPLKPANLMAYLSQMGKFGVTFSKCTLLLVSIVGCLTLKVWVALIVESTHQRMHMPKRCFKIKYSVQRRH